MSSLSIANELLAFAEQYTLYSTTIILIIGLIGNILNVIVFLNLKIFRKKCCAFYLIIESLVNTIQLILLFLMRFLIKLNNEIDPANTSLLWCKLRTVLSQPMTLLSISIVCFASYDQFLSTSHRSCLRERSTYTLAQNLTLIALYFCIIHSIPFGIFLGINSSFGCVISNLPFNRYYQFFYYPILIGILPILISSIFSFLAFRNVRRLVRLQVPITRRRLDHQLTAMILTRTVIFIILCLPFTIHRIYWLQIDHHYIDLTRTAIDSLIRVIMFSLFNFNFAASFYIFLFSSTRFRQQVKCVLVKKFWRRWTWWCHFNNNQINPLVILSSNSSIELEL